MAIRLNGATNVNVAENTAIGFVIGTLSATAGDVSTIESYQLAEASDFFKIFENTSTEQWELKLKAGVDYEIAVQQQHLLKITVTADGEDSAAEDITINVTNVNDETPTDLTLSGTTVVENAAAGTVVGLLGASDPDFGDSFTFTLKDTSGAFKIESGKLVVANGAKLNFETAASHQIEIVVKDAAGHTFKKTLTIGITDGVDSITGTSRNDKLFGTAGDDRINGGAGKDHLTGFGGKDTFVFDTPVKKGQFDQIKDFKSVDDTIEISLSAIKSLKVKGLHEGKLKKKFFSVGEPDDRNDYVYYNKKNGFVYLDSDGQGGKKGIEILKLKPGTSLSCDDFLFV